MGGTRMVRFGRLLLLLGAVSPSGCAFDRAPVMADAGYRDPNWACRALHRPAGGGSDGGARTTYGGSHDGPGVLVVLALIPILAGACAVSRL